MAPQISRLFEAFRAQPDPSAGPATPPAPPAPVAAAVRLPAMPVPPDAQKLRPNAGRPPGAKRPRADLPPVFAPDRAIPAPPDTPRSGPRPSQRVEMDADTIGWLLGPTFTEQVLSGELGAIESSDAQRQVACFLSNGWLLLSKHDPLNVHAMQLKADILRGRHVITREFLVDLEVIRKVYKRSDEGFGGDARSPAQIAGVETQEFQREFLALVKEAARRRCSDIHITVERFEATIRVRADGQMETLRQVPSEWASMLCASAFNMADASDSAYRPLDYQGARISNIRTPLPESIQAIRLQFNPLPNGGRYMICRLLYESSAAQSEGDIDTLGYSASHIVQIKRMRKKPFGINIISGPTGSGKSTTLQRALSTLMREKRGINVITIEDPPEYVIKGAAQLPVLNAQTDEERNEKFRQAISASLRSDPDVIMIGEIRDRASSSLAFAAAMTGHQVWASLHANDAISITDRLRDQQVEDYKLSDPSLVTGMIGQRLIRRLCDRCKTPLRQALAQGVIERDLARQVLRVAGDRAEDVCLANPDGCERCRGGYSGRAVIAECIVPDLPFMKHVRLGHKEDAIRYWLDELHGLTMLEHAVQKMTKGQCDPRDVEDKAGDLTAFDVARSGPVFGALYE